MSNLGYITPQITMSLGDGSIDLGALGYITPQITMSLGQPQLGYITPQITTMLGQGEESDSSAGRILFGAMLLGLGISMGFALGMSHGVRALQR